MSRNFKPLRALAVAAVVIAVGAGVEVRAQPAFVVDGQPVRTRPELGPDLGCLLDGSSADRYVDCGDGTVRDAVTGLVWLKRANCTELPGTGGVNSASWPTAMQAASDLADGVCDLSDGSQPGDWRLPTEKEWEATIAHARDALSCTGVNAPTWTNDAGTACYSMAVTSFIGIAAAPYWSSTVDQSNPGIAEVGNLSTGTTTVGIFKFSNAAIWPVRDAR